MSFTLLLAVTAAVAASMGYMAARKHGDEAPDGDDEDGDKKQPPRERPPREKAAKPPTKRAGPSPFADLPLALGDVVSANSEERWLAGAVVAREGAQVIGAVFLAPEGAVNKAVAVFAPPRKECWWMSPVEVAFGGSGAGEPPGTLEVAGGPMQRKARLPVALERMGQGAPAVGAEGLWAVYERGNEVALVVSSGGQVFAWAGARLEEHEYDRLGGGG